MAKYLLQVSYTVDGIKGLLKDGGTARRKAAQQVAEALGGRIESLYFAFGDSDAYIIADMPDNTSVAAVALAVAASGTIRPKTTVLLTPEEVDAAAKKTVSFRPPGQ